MAEGPSGQVKQLDLNKIQVTNPCSTNWDGMEGDDKTRYCDTCNKRVFNLAAMTGREVELLVRETNGRFCARVIRDADGSIITAAENTGFNSVRLRASKFASAIISATLGLSPLVTITAGANPAHQVQSEKESKRDLATTKAQDGIAKIYGTVFDPNGAVVPRAILTLTNEKTNDQFVTTSSETGNFQFNAIHAGTYELKVDAPGFILLKMTNLELSANTEWRRDAILKPGLLQGGVAVADFRAMSLDTVTIPELLFKPIKAIQLRVKEQNKNPARKKKNQN